MRHKNKTLSYQTDRPVLPFRTFQQSLSYHIGQPVLPDRTFRAKNQPSLSCHIGHYIDIPYQGGFYA